MTGDEMKALCLKHTMYTWTAQSAVDPMPVARAKGVYFWTPEGKRYLDFNSQLMSVNIGHSHPHVIAAMKAQLDKELLYCFPGTATEVRARLGEKLASIVPGDINTFFFCLGGAEANENAIKAVRLYTGKHKILARYRSYHGATNAAMQLTGDPRRLHNEPGMPGVVHVMDPQPYWYSFGESEEEKTANNLKYLEEVIHYEGTDKIAAMWIEPVTGTNGILPPPKGYLKGLRDLLDKYGILLVCDEVMAGWGRTGKLFAFEHGDIVPDVVTTAKGLTSSYIPLGFMGVSDPIAEYFRENVFWGGLTYNSHALALATALATIEVMENEGLIDNAARLDPIMRARMQQLQADHPCVKEVRNIGLFGMIDVQNAEGDFIAGYNGSHPAMNALKGHFKEEGLFTFLRGSHIMSNPPLCITEDQLMEGFDVIDRGLSIVDAQL